MIENPEYGQTVYIQLYSHDTHQERLAYVPDMTATSFIEAYRASLYGTREEADAAVAASFKEQQDDHVAQVQADIASGDADADEGDCEVEPEEFVVEGVVNEDGSITYEGAFELTVEEIWGRYELPVPDFAASKLSAGI
jgi:hypothetical protein